MQRLWELKVDWDDPLPSDIREAWLQWRSELKCLSDKHIPRCYFPDQANIVAVELHGFSDASEHAYAGVIYLRLIDSSGDVHISIVTSKTKVASIKRLTIPRLELCGAYLLAQLLHHVQQVFNIPLSCIYAWTDSTVVLSWLVGNPRRFKTFVGNRVSHIVDLISPGRCRHVNGAINPADCASRGLYPTELLNHELWWNGPDWLKSPRTDWPKPFVIAEVGPSDEEREVCVHVTLLYETPLISLDRFSHFTRYKYVTAWVLRFINNCRVRNNTVVSLSPRISLCRELLGAALSRRIFCRRNPISQSRSCLAHIELPPQSTPHHGSFRATSRWRKTGECPVTLLGPTSSNPARKA